MARRSVMVLPVGDGREQVLTRVIRTEVGYEVEEIEPVVFVPMLSGVV
jgi:protein-L-isoaspartate(D-aspartate) O-methyltransferase